ncbi:unnamed protein product [Owenia fusiformis]|uniref:Uncharacterized protein n=1 Tax=Owenia fusiformis TaxID=6347 RepID=A0A8J1XK53_OWEFU|nr:unnamed protein product [Owenia fusiformis]
MSQNMNSKCVIITGSSNGIGQGAAIEFAKCGASVLIHGRDEEAIQNTVQMCKEAAGDKDAKFPSVRGDIKDECTLKAIVDAAMTEFGKIDVLINNAGGGTVGATLTGLEMESYDEQMAMDLSVRAPIRLSQLCFPELQKSQGNILNISAVSGVRPAVRLPFYAIAKAALNMFTQCAALEMGPKGVRINALALHVVPTMIHERSGIMKPDDDKAAFYERCSTVVPLKRLATVDDCAKMMAFLTSDASCILNGEVIVNDGGRSLTGF